MYLPLGNFLSEQEGHMAIMFDTIFFFQYLSYLLHQERVSADYPKSTALGAMSLITWNCRGLQKGPTRRRVHHFIQQFKPSMMYFYETLTLTHTACKYFSSLGFSKLVGVDAKGKSGGTILVWSEDINIHVLDLSSYWIHVEWHMQNDRKVIITFVYEHPQLQLRHGLWSFMKSVAMYNSLPWLLVGDFNQVLCAKDKNSHCVMSQVQTISLRTLTFVVLLM